MSQSKAEAIVARLLSSVAGLRFGSVSVIIKIHSGRIMQVSYETTESMREIETAETKESDTGE